MEVTLTNEAPAQAPDVQIGEIRAMPVARYDDESWRQAAACRDVNPVLFFPNGSTGAAREDIERAKAICSGCGVRRACLVFAVATNQQFGIWGGCDEDERRAVRRRWRAAMARAKRRAELGRSTPGRAPAEGDAYP